MYHITIFWFNDPIVVANMMKSNRQNLQKNLSNSHNDQLTGVLPSVDLSWKTLTYSVESIA